MEPCCEVLEDREETQLQPDLVVSVCKTCGRRHFELTVDPAVFDFTGAGLS